MPMQAPPGEAHERSFKKIFFKAVKLLMMSPAMALMICTPNSLSVFLHDSTFTKPSVSMLAIDRPFAAKENLPFRYSTPHEMPS